MLQQHKTRIVLFLIYFLTFSSAAGAKDFGSRGANYKIAEESILVMLQRKLGEVDLAKEEEKMRRIAKERVKAPVPVSSVIPAQKTREFRHDPTYVVPEAVVLPCGKVLYRAGESVNPLKPSSESEVIKLNRRLLFIDARRSQQVKWLKEQLDIAAPEDNKEIEDRVILVGGSPLMMQEELGCQVYFDQGGELTNRFGIKHSPAIVVQDGEYLQITEVAIDHK